MSQCGSGQWREKVNQEMMAAQHLYEKNVKVSVACAYDETEKQIEQIDSLTNSGIDLLVVAPNEAAPLADAISRARKKGIPVIYFDRKAANEDFTAFIGGSNVEAGYASGRYAALLANEVKGHKPLVMEVTGAMSTSPAQERHEGFAKAMSEHDNLEYVCKKADWTSDMAYKITKEQIGSGKIPDIVFCHNDGMATGVYKAKKEMLDTDDAHLNNMEPKIIGVDGLPGEGMEYVQLGHQAGTYIYPTHGEEVVKLAIDILIGRPYQRNNMLEGMMVTSENVDMIDRSSREMMRQNNNLITIEGKLEHYFGLVNLQKNIIAIGILAIALLLVAMLLIWRALRQTRRTIRQRQTMNEEQALFYTDATTRQIRDIVEKQDNDLPPPNKQDILFAEQLNEAIRKHMSNPNLKMEELGDEIGISRVQLYRKVKAVTGLSPVELLRQMRLQRAYAMLGATTKSVAEIAFEVGFNTPGYFSKCFKEQYGKLPMDLRT